MSKQEVEKLIAMVSTTEWQPLPLEKIAAVTGGAKKMAGSTFRSRLGLKVPRGLATRPEPGLTFIGDAYGQRFAWVYGITLNGGRYFWRRWPQGASDDAIMADAGRRFGEAFMVDAEPTSAQPSLIKLVPAPKPDGLEGLTDADLLRRADQAQRELDALMDLRNKRIAMLQEQIDRLRTGLSLTDTSAAGGLATAGR